ncbi:ABC transporter substrate-binding protein [Terrilactibacillus laevilacticus]|uniref:ABC transporter substrate-binding protein n=1 Tax=Terrilactibacillus laevilacticus TaxID=1380157 RepID=A0ABW5PMR2_9BACI|nr:ABC transporter substrate-binding protein [Terrilactibacillus laevilacticus]
MKKIISALIIVMCFVLVLSGCGGSSSSGGSTSKKDGTMIIGMESEADVLDPHSATGWVTMRVNNQIYQPLIGEDLTKSANEAPTPKLVGVLAKNWDVSEDGKTYTFNLRENVKFTDGTPFDAEAVAFNLDRLTNKNFKYYYELGNAKTYRTWLYYKNYKIVNGHNIQINLSQPFPDFPRMLAQINSLQIVSPTAVKKYGNEKFGNHPVGTGPFKFQSRVRGSKIVLVRNNDYWGKKAYLSKVIFRPISDASSRVLALENGEVDMIAVPPADSLSKLKKEDFNISYTKPPHVWYLVFNMENKEMKNIKVRQAINYAINRDGIANSLLKGSAMPANTIQAPGSSAYDPNKNYYPYNVEKAKQLMKEAGYGNGFTTTLRTSTDGSGQLIPTDIAEWIQRDLAKIGIKVKIDTQEWINYYSTFMQGMPPNVGMNQMSSGRTTPYFLSMIANSKYMAPGGMNSGRYDSKELDTLLNSATTAKNQEESIKLWKKAEDMMMKDPGWAPIVNDKAPYAISKSIKNFVNPAEEWYDLSNVWTTNKN